MRETRQHTTLLLLGEQNTRPASEDGLWQLLNLVSDVYWQEDEAFVCLNVRCEDTADNRQLYNSLPGQTPWQFGITPLPDSISPEDHLQLRSEHKPFAEQLFRLHRDGQTLYLRISGEAQFGQDGQFLGYHCLARDVTHQRDTEHKRNGRFAAALDDPEKSPLLKPASFSLLYEPPAPPGAGDAPPHRGPHPRTHACPPRRSSARA